MGTDLVHMQGSQETDNSARCTLAYQGNRLMLAGLRPLQAVQPAPYPQGLAVPDQSLQISDGITVLKQVARTDLGGQASPPFYCGFALADHG